MWKQRNMRGIKVFLWRRLINTTLFVDRRIVWCRINQQRGSMQIVVVGRSGEKQFNVSRSLIGSNRRYRSPISSRIMIRSIFDLGSRLFFGSSFIFLRCQYRHWFLRKASLLRSQDKIKRLASKSLSSLHSVDRGRNFKMKAMWKLLRNRQISTYMLLRGRGPGTRRLSKSLRGFQIRICSISDLTSDVHNGCRGHGVRRL